MTRLIRIVVLLTIVFQWSALHANPDDFTANFRLLTLGRIGEDLYYRQGSDIAAVQPRLNRFSKSYQFTISEGDSPELTLYRKVGGSAPNNASTAGNGGGGEPDPSYEPLGSVRFQAPGDYILVLNPVYVDPERPREIRSLRLGLMRDELASLPNDQWLMVNTTQTPIIARIGEDGEPFMIEARSRVQTQVKPDRSMELVQFAAEIEEDGGWRVIYSTGWPVFEETRYLILFTQRPNSDRIGVHRIAN